MQNASNEARAEFIIVDRSLNSIKEAQVMLRNLGSAPDTPDMLASQIHLCEFLLHEISGIRNRLEKGVHARCPSAMLEIPRRNPIELAWPEHLRPRLGGMRLRRVSASGSEPFICARCQRPC